MVSAVEKGARWGWDGSSVVALEAELVMVVMLWVFGSQSAAESPSRAGPGVGLPAGGFNPPL